MIGSKKSLLALLTCVSACSLAQAAITINIYESGSDLVMETSGGTLNLGDLAFDKTSNTWGAGIQFNAPFDAFYAGGTQGNNNSSDEYLGDVSFSGDPFSGLDDFQGSDSVSTLGDFFGAGTFGVVFVPQGYASGNPISASSVSFTDKSLADIGWSVGNSATLSWGTGNADSITLTAVPEPSHFALGAGFVGLAVVGIRRFRSKKV